MNYRIFHLIILPLVMLAMASCHGKKDEPLPPEPEPQPGELAKRTVLVYMAANNSLGSYSYDYDDLNEMSQAAIAYGLNGCRLIVFHHPKGAQPVLKEILGDGSQKEIKEYNLDGAYSTDPEVMVQVMADMKRIAPAEDYGLVLWSHGSGWANSSTSRSVPQRAWGDDSGHHAKVTSLAQTLAGQGFSFIYFDCCYMASVEVAYQLRNAARVIVGSVAELPTAGMDYRCNVPVFTADEPDMVMAATNTFNLYDSQFGSNRTCTMSVIRTDALTQLADATRAIFEQHPDAPDMNDMQQFERYISTPTLYDMSRYIDCLEVDEALKAQWHQALDNVVVYQAATPYVFGSLKINYHCGLSTFIMQSPGDASLKGYNTLDWYNDVACSLFEDRQTINIR